MTAIKNYGVAYRWPHLERALASAGLEPVRVRADYEAWGRGGSVYVLLYQEGNWIVWDEAADEEVDSGFGAINLEAALARISETGAVA